MSDASVESPHIFFKPPVEGRRLARQLSKMSSARKALLAHEIETGTVSISKLSRRQTSRLLKVATGYIATVSRISNADRERLKHNPYLMTAWHNPALAEGRRRRASPRPHRARPCAQRLRSPDRAGAEGPTRRWVSQTAPPRAKRRCFFFRGVNALDITPSPEFCQACRIVLGGDTPDVVTPALRTDAADRIHQIHAEILEGKRPFMGPLDPPAGTLAPLPHMRKAILEAAGPEDAVPDSVLADDGSGPEDLPIEPPRLRAVMPGPPVEGDGIQCVECGARPFADCWPEKPRETFDLLKIAGKWRCELHRGARR